MFELVRRLGVALLLLFAAELASAQNPPAPANPGEAAAARERRVVRVAYIPGTAALPVIVGLERGLFLREGLIVSPLPVTDLNSVMNGLNGGYFDIAVGSQSWLLDIAHNGKIGAKVVAIDSHGREMELIGPAWDKSIKTLADLKGRTILFIQGIHNFDAVTEFYRVLSFSKLKLSDVRIVFIPMDQTGAIFAQDAKTKAAVQQRKIAGVYAPREITVTYTENKTARVVASNDEITSLIGRRAARPVLASAATIKNTPGTIQRFVNAWVKTQDYIVSDKSDAANLLNLYFARQFGQPLTKERAEYYVGLAKYDRADWGEEDIKEININGRAVSAARNILFSSIKDEKKRPFQTAPTVDAYFDRSFVTKALEKRAADKKAEAEKKAGPPTPSAAEKDPTVAPPGPPAAAPPGAPAAKPAEKPKG